MAPREKSRGAAVFGLKFGHTKSNICVCVSAASPTLNTVLAPLRRTPVHRLNLGARRFYMSIEGKHAYRFGYLSRKNGKQLGWRPWLGRKRCVRSVGMSRSRMTLTIFGIRRTFTKLQNPTWSFFVALAMILFMQWYRIAKPVMNRKAENTGSDLQTRLRLGGSKNNFSGNSMVLPPSAVSGMRMKS